MTLSITTNCRMTLSKTQEITTLSILTLIITSHKTAMLGAANKPIMRGYYVVMLSEFLGANAECKYRIYLENKRKNLGETY
jgi:hypothetical protein